MSSWGLVRIKRGQLLSFAIFCQFAIANFSASTQCAHASSLPRTQPLTRFSNLCSKVTKNWLVPKKARSVLNCELPYLPSRDNVHLVTGRSLRNTNTLVFESGLRRSPYQTRFDLQTPNTLCATRTSPPPSPRWGSHKLVPGEVSRGPKGVNSLAAS